MNDIRVTTPAPPAPETAPGSALDFKAEFLALIPFLRAFARSLCRHREMADDLAQETLVKAWQARASFAPGTNLKAWLFMIARNQFYSDRRRAWRQVDWDSQTAEQIVDRSHDPIRAAELSDTARAMRNLNDEQREALILVGAGGFSYEEAASICGCPVGTVKSRVARARTALLAMLDGDAGCLSDRDGQEDAAIEIVSELERLAPGRVGQHTSL